MEDFIAYILIAAFLTIPVWVGIVLYRKHKKAQTEAQRRWIEDAERLAAHQRERERKRQQDIASAYVPPRKTASKSKATGTAGSSGYSTSSSTASQPADTWSNDLLTTMIVADTISNALNAISHHSESSSGSGGGGSSSWGLDDADSRKSASDTFGSSSSSWDSSSSSSDSGPSSDW